MNRKKQESSGIDSARKEGEAKKSKNTDEELAQLYQAGDPEAADILLEAYKPLVRRLSRELYLIGGDREDLLQEGMMGLFKAIRTFDAKRKSSFSAYAYLLISRSLYTAIAASHRRKNSPLNESVSMNELEESQKETQALGQDLMQSPENILIDRESALSLQDKIEQRLSPLEQKVFDLYLEGLDYQEIARMLNRKPKSVDNALQRIRTKTSDILHSIDQ